MQSPGLQVVGNLGKVGGDAVGPDQIGLRGKGLDFTL